MAATSPPLAERPAPTRAQDDYGPSGRPEWMDIDWREHRRDIVVEGRRLNVVEMGDGPPLLLIHGHSGSWTNWLENIPALARSYRVIAPDLPGFGGSEMPARPISIAGYGATIDALCDELDIESASIVGNSMGGFVGAEVAIKFATRVTHLVLVDAAGLSTRYVGLPSNLLQRRAVLTFARAVNLFATIPDARAETLMRRRRLRRLVLEMIVAHPQRLSAPMCAELLRGSGRPAAPDATDAIMSYDFRDRVEEISSPTLIVWGKQDRVVPAACAEEYARLIPHARTVLFDDTGHLPMVERPARFNELLESFLSE